MSEVQAQFERILERVVAWAEGRADVRAVLVIGSAARTLRPADAWSDLDVVILATHPEQLAQEVAWLDRLGPVVLTSLEDPELESTAPGAARERRVVLEGGLDVELAFFSASQVSQLAWALRLLQRFPSVVRMLPGGLRRGLMQQIDAFLHTARRGLRVVLDKDGRLRRMAELVPATPMPPRESPTQEEFSALANDFLYHVVWVAKKLCRGELWMAKVAQDRCLKWMLLRLMEWHARAVHGTSYNTWYVGRFIDQWADPRAVRALREALPGYDEADSREALLASLALFRWLAEETGARLGLVYPLEAHARVEDWLQHWFARPAATA